jgi:anaerobic selenocysteine-containing dehydrogenase
MKILNELGKALGDGQYWHEDYEGFLSDVLDPSGISYEQFVTRGYLKGPDLFQKYLDSGFKTPTGKVELCLSQAEKYHLSPLPEFKAIPEDEATDYPLVLTSAKSPYFLHSSYRWVEKLRKYNQQPRAEIHPETASKYFIAEGQEIVIETKKGSIRQIAHLNKGVHPRVVHASYGWWFPEETTESQYGWQKANFNVLTSTHCLGKEFGTPNLKGIACRIGPV